MAGAAGMAGAPPSGPFWYPKERRVQPIGQILRLQVQRASLKVGQAPRRRYDPTPLCAVSRLTLEDGGVVGWSERDERLDDVHHSSHPASKHRGDNGVSLCFTAHYDAMRERFGAHLADGLAAENILVRTDQLYGEDDLTAGLLIETADGERVRLGDVTVATPCVEFARFSLRFPEDARPDRTVADALAFLNDGMRGYYASYRGAPTPIRVGDRVWIR